jgi:hypothetical protein
MSTETEKSPETVVNCIAEMAHEMNRIYCKAHGDLTVKPWKKASQHQKESVVAGVMAILGDPSLTPARSHEGWMAFKIADGWVYGPEKDEVAKTHPCLMDFDKLPEYQRVKDNLFGVVVRLGSSLFFRECPDEAPQMRDLPTTTDPLDSSLDTWAAMNAPEGEAK